MTAQASDPRDPMVILDERLLVVTLAESSQCRALEAVELLVDAHRGDAEFWRRAACVASHARSRSMTPAELADWRAQAIADALGGGTAGGKA